MLDTRITGGTIVDGTGSPGFAGDIGIRDGRIVAIGHVDEDAKVSIDASGRVVAPGFVDVHTHYDAQAFWDPTLSPSCYHGVTTVVGGFCGFSIAPLSAESADYIKPMLARVEGMPLETLDAALPWNWSSFADYLARLDGKIGLNAGFFVGHSAIRRVVMGPRAVGEKATPEELERMKDLLDTSLAEGGLGLSTTVSATHNDGDGNPVPSRWADRNEFIELAGVVSRHEGTGLEMLPNIAFDQEMIDLITDFSIAAKRPVNWNLLMVNDGPGAEAEVERQLAVTNYARERGGEIIALLTAATPGIYQSLRTGFVFDSLPGLWRDIFKVPVAERIERFKDPSVRKQLADDAATIPAGTPYERVAALGRYAVASVDTEQNKKYEGRRIKDIAAEEGRTVIDVMCDIAVADELETIFQPDHGDDRDTIGLRAQIWADDRTLIGASDAGAHLDLIDTFALSTQVLQLGVREYGVISLEQAVHQLTQRPATYFGLVDRGVIREGYHADLVIFDPATVGRGPIYKRYDVPPTGELRIYADAEGIDHVLVNGVEIVRDGLHTGQLPGKVLRSGEDTRTMPMDALRAAKAEDALVVN